MYAVVSSGGKQYRVEPGTTLVLERLTAEPGSAVTFDRVLLVGDGDHVTVGTPLVLGATVSGTVVAQDRGPKLVIYKFKPKVKYRRRTGHRQQLTVVRIEAINANGAGETPAASAAEARKPRPRTRSRAAKAEETAAAAEGAPAKPVRRRASAASASVSTRAKAELAEAEAKAEKPKAARRKAQE